MSAKGVWALRMEFNADSGCSAVSVESARNLLVLRICSGFSELVLYPHSLVNRYMYHLSIRKKIQVPQDVGEETLQMARFSTGPEVLLLRPEENS